MTKPAIAIFDGVFVAENVHSGEVVDIEHKRNLYRVIIGDDGVKLAADDAELAASSRAKTTEIATAGKAIQPHVPAGMKLETFLALPVTADIETQITEQERILEAVRQAGAIRDRASLSPFTLPRLPEGLEALLSRTIDDIAQDAERLLAAHLETHAMTTKGANWIATGIEHAGETCPFCGQDIRGLPVIAAFRAVFSAQYKALASDVVTAKTAVSQAFGDAALARLDTVAEQNRGGVEFWAKYCSVDAPPLALSESVTAAARALAGAALSLLDRKAAAPLEPIPLDEAFTAALAAYEVAARGTEATNAAIRAVNQTISGRRPRPALPT